jgi:hypothetical protein
MPKKIRAVKNAMARKILVRVAAYIARMKKSALK